MAGRLSFFGSTACYTSKRDTVEYSGLLVAGVRLLQAMPIFLNILKARLTIGSNTGIIHLIK